MSKNKNATMTEKLRAIYSEAKKISFPPEDVLKKDILIVIGVSVVCSLLLWGISTGTLAIFKNALNI
jgi:preprotein translocase SecE subunit